MGQVPDLVAAHDDGIAVRHALGLVEWESRRERQCVECLEEPLHLPAIRGAIRGTRAGNRPQRALPLGDVHAPRFVIEDHRVMAESMQPPGQAACLPVAAVVDAAMECKYADLHGTIYVLC